VFLEEEAGVSVKVVRDGIPIIRASFKLAKPMPISEMTMTSDVFNLKMIPSCEQGAPPDVKRLFHHPFVVTNRGIRFGTAELELKAAEYDPFDKIPILKVTRAGYAESNFSFGFGKVVYDYLAVK